MTLTASIQVKDYPANSPALKAVPSNRAEAALADVCIIGLGYVGLPLAAILANKAMTVAGVDIREDVINNVNTGRAPAFEPQLERMVKDASEAGMLSASLQPSPAHIFIIAVPTPIDAEKKADLIPVPADQHWWAQSRKPMDMIRHGCSTSLFQASQQWSRMSS